MRRSTLDKAEHDQLYAGLTQLYFNREKMAGLTTAVGLRVKLTTQENAGGGNCPCRFKICFEKTRTGFL